ncbi:MAG: hypothetical protein PVI03_04195 [Candidatus Thorarchaeota archaeon]
MTPKEAGDMVISAFETANRRWHWQIQRVPWCKDCMKKMEELRKKMVDTPAEGMPNRP